MFPLFRDSKEAKMAILRPLLTLTTTILALAITSFATGPSRTANYPSRPVKVIVPYPPGGGNDFIARLLVQRLSEAGTQSYVENLPGAGGTIGTRLGWLVTLFAWGVTVAVSVTC